MSSTYYTRWMTLLRLDSGRFIFVIIKLIILGFQQINLQALTKALKILMKKLSTENASDAAEPSIPMVRKKKIQNENKIELYIALCSKQYLADLMSRTGQHMWRWTGFNSGLDLIVTYDSFKLTLKASNGDNDNECENQCDR